jgi:hypothetical protein
MRVVMSILFTEFRKRWWLPLGEDGEFPALLAVGVLMRTQAAMKEVM